MAQVSTQDKNENSLINWQIVSVCGKTIHMHFDIKMVLTKAVTAHNVSIFHLDSKRREHSMTMSWIYNHPFHGTLCDDNDWKRDKYSYMNSTISPCTVKEKHQFQWNRSEKAYSVWIHRISEWIFCDVVSNISLHVHLLQQYGSYAA